MFRTVLPLMLIFSFAFNAFAVPEALSAPLSETQHESCCCGHAEICQCIHAAQQAFGKDEMGDKTSFMKAPGCGLLDEAVKVLLSSREYYFHDLRTGFFVPAPCEAILTSSLFSFPILDLSIDLPPKLA